MEVLLCAGTGEIALHNINSLCLHEVFILERKNNINKDKDSVSGSEGVGGQRESQGYSDLV